ncbi:MAG: ABC transporter substrate-binding protein, partial [Xanthobacteraceae bacterium]
MASIGISFKTAAVGAIFVSASSALYLMFAAAALHADEPLTLRISTISTIDSAALEAARSQGYFAAEGLNVDTMPMVGGAVGLPALAAGQVQIASSNIVSVILGAKQGL